MKNKAFTLAEVLITLGLIGVVAAMTIPTLIAHVNYMKYKTRFKKTLSTLNQAVRIAENRYDLSFASPLKRCGESASTENPETTATMCALLNATLSGAKYYENNTALNIPGTNEPYKIPALTAFGGQSHMYQLADGTNVFFDLAIQTCTVDVGNNATSLTSRCQGFIDVNGAALPNREVRCTNWQLTGWSSSAGDCIVNTKSMGDIIPVVFHDNVVEPSTNAGWYVLKQAK